MSFRRKKIVVLAVLATVILLANAWTIAGWLDTLGVVGLAQYLRSEYTTGTAVAIILALIFLLDGGSTYTRKQPPQRCPTCDHIQLRPGKYCAECGSRV